MVPVTFTGDAVQCLSENQEGETEDEIIVAALAIHNGYDEDISVYIFSRDFIQMFKNEA